MTGKRTDFHQAHFCEGLMYLQCLHYGTRDHFQKNFQDENIVIEAKQLLGNLVYDTKKKFAVWKLGRTQGKKNNNTTPSLK